MKITSVSIHNFRSIKNCTLLFRDILVLLGQNNHGKSNLIGAIQFALDSSSKPDKDDLFAFARGDDKEIWVEVSFDKLTEQEKITWMKYVQSDGTFCFRKTATFEDQDKPKVYYNGYVSQPEEEWLQEDNANNYTNRSKISETPLKSYVPSTGQITKQIVIQAQQKYIGNHRESLTFSRMLESGPLLGTRNVSDGVLTRFFLIPAVRDLADESKVKSTTLLGKLLTFATNEMASFGPLFPKIDENLKELLNVLNPSPDNNERPRELVELESSINEGLRRWGVNVSLEVTPPTLLKIFELGTEIYVNDGHRTLANQKGHGLQRALIFSLMTALAKSMLNRSNSSTDSKLDPRKKSDLVIFAIEEPELFLHPHGQRSLDKALRVIAESENTQVLVSSHSTHFVNLNDYKGIALIRKNSAEEGTTLIQCTEDLFEEDEDRKSKFHMATWVNPDRGEMFFARKVVFVEGETEKTVFPFLAEKLRCNSDGVSFIDCGSKYNISLYVTIAKAFQMSYVVIHDEDPLPDPMPNDWKQDKRKSFRNTYDLNSKIEQLVGDTGSVIMLSKDFEDCAGVSKNKGIKKGKALAALDHLDSLNVNNIPDVLVKAVRKIYE